MTVQLVSSRKHISLGGFQSFSSNFGIEQASLCREQSVYSRSQLCVGTGSESGALQREVRGVFWAMVMGVSVNNGAVGGGFGSAFDPAAETSAGWLMWERSAFWGFFMFIFTDASSSVFPVWTWDALLHCVYLNPRWIFQSWMSFEHTKQAVYVWMCKCSVHLYKYGFTASPNLPPQH